MVFDLSPGRPCPYRGMPARWRKANGPKTTIMQQTAPYQTPGWGQELRAMLGLAGPLAAANLLQMLTYAVDVIFIARLGEQELAGSALSVSLSVL